MKNLLFITRKVDNNDERVSFVTDWILEFAKNLKDGKLIIICQEKGEINNLIENIEVHSLGKEKGYSKLRQIWNFQILMLKHIKRVDGVFSHMIQHYSILAGPWCKFFNKKLIQWYTHKSVNIWLKIADFFVDGFVTASEQSFQLKTKKPVYIFGHGINIYKFNPDINDICRKNDEYKDRFVILTVGRISPSKNVNLIIGAVKEIYFNNPEIKNKIFFQIIGAPGLASQQSYYLDLIEDVKKQKLNSVIKFLGPLSHSNVLPYYGQCDVFVNLSDTGAIDKVNLEAMAFGKVVLTSNKAYKNILPEILFLQEKNVDLLAEKIKKIYYMNKNERLFLGKKLRNIVVQNHNLENLAKKIVKLYD